MGWLAFAGEIENNHHLILRDAFSDPGIAHGASLAGKA
jgi:hypothetical protein